MEFPILSHSKPSILRHPHFLKPLYTPTISYFYISLVSDTGLGRKETQRRIPDLQVSPCVKKMDSRMRPWRTHFTTVAAVQTRHIKTQDTFTTFQDNQFLNGNLFLVCPKCDHRNEVHGIQHLEWSRHCGVLCRSVQESAGMPHLPGKLPSWWQGAGTCSEVTPTWLWSMSSPNLNDHSYRILRSDIYVYKIIYVLTQH